MTSSIYPPPASMAYPTPPTGDDNYAMKLLSFFTGSSAASARRAIRAYFTNDYTGSRFELQADPDPNRITARDIVAVSMLGVNVPAPVSVRLLDCGGSIEISELLSAVPTGTDIWDAADHIGEGSPLWRLWELLDTACWPSKSSANGMGPTTISKLLAAKRPRLVPITDSVVIKVLPSRGHWADFSRALSSVEHREVIQAATSDAPAHVSLLRRIDVVIWMLSH